MDETGVLGLLEELSILLEDSKPVFGKNNLRQVDIAAAFDIMDEIRDLFPAEFSQARQIVRERQSLLDDAEVEANRMIEDARSQAITIASEQEIDEINILQATFLAMRRAMDQLRVRPDIALIDGNRETDFGLPVQTIVKGDSLSANIAAASILAKVTRDRFMLEMDEKYPQYGFATHKGYGTRAHYAALREFGPCPIHRRTFLKNLHAE